MFELSTVISGFGPLIGYVFIAKVPLGWRTVYWWSFSFEAVTAILVFFFYKPPSFKTKHAEDNKSKLALLKELDYFGLFLFASGLTLLLIGITWVWLSLLPFDEFDEQLLLFSYASLYTNTILGRRSFSLEECKCHLYYYHWVLITGGPRILGGLRKPQISHFPAQVVSGLSKVRTCITLSIDHLLTMTYRIDSPQTLYLLQLPTACTTV